MFAILAILATVVSEGSSFPTQPIAEQVEVGARLARKSPGATLNDLRRSPEPRAAFNNIWSADRKAVGWWSNGHEKVPVEHVIWISPSLVSRWLGFLAQREYWDDGELQSRWEAVTSDLAGRKTFVVTLTAYPKMPFHGIGDYKRPDPTEIDNVRFVYTSGEKAQRMSAVRMVAWQSRDRKQLEGLAWWHLTKFGEHLIGEFEEQNLEPPLPLGDYYRSWYFVTIEDSIDERFEVRVLSKRKERVAKFRTKVGQVKPNANGEDPRKSKTSRSPGTHRHGPLQQGLVNGLYGKRCEK